MRCARCSTCRATSGRGRSCRPTPPPFASDTVTPDDMMKLAIANRPELAQARTRSSVRAAGRAAGREQPAAEIDLGLSGGLIGQDSTYGGALRESAAPTRPPTRCSSTSRGRRCSARRARARRDRARTHHQVGDRASRSGAPGHLVRRARCSPHAGRRGAPGVRGGEVARAVDEEPRDRAAQVPVGQSSNFVVAQHQEELAQAQLAELQAVLVHKKATAALLRATGRLLDERHIQLDVTAPAR